MILFGVAEVFTGLFLGRRIGVSVGKSTVFVYEGGAIGTLYVIGGLLLLTGRKWAAGLAEVCLAADVAVAIGTAIAVLRHLHRIEVEVLKVSDRARLRAGGIDSRLKFRTWIAGSRSCTVVTGSEPPAFG
jgi:hypothetical protein